MTVNTQQVLEKAIHLPPEERAKLVEQILSSFDTPSRDKIDALWTKEAENCIVRTTKARSRRFPQAKCLRASTVSIHEDRLCCGCC